MKLTQIKPFGLIAEATMPDMTLLDIPKEEIVTLINEFQLIIFRNFNTLADDDYCDFAKQFGNLLAWEFGDILELKIHENPANHIFNAGRVELHWDGCYLDVEPHYNLFQCVNSSDNDSGGKTLFVNAINFWEKSTPKQKELWDSVTVEYSTEKKAHYGGSLKSALFPVNPYNGKKVLRYIEAFNEDSQHINATKVAVEGYSPSESDAFLRELNYRVYQKEVMYEHTWKTGDFLMADNSNLLHGRSRFDSDQASRYIKRINIL